MLLLTFAQQTQPDHPIALVIYILILVAMIILGFWLLSLIIKQQRFPLPISFPMLLSLYMQRVPIDLLSDAIRLLQQKNQHIDLYRTIKIYLNNWQDIETPTDLAKLLAPDIDFTELKWKSKNDPNSPNKSQ